MGGFKINNALTWLSALTLALTLSAALTGCFSIAPPIDDGSGQNKDPVSDPTPDNNDDDDDEEPAPSPPPPPKEVAIELTHSEIDIIVPGNAVACTNQNDENAAQSYYRVFDLSDRKFEVGAELKVESVEFAVEEANNFQGSRQPLSVHLHTLDGTMNTSNMTQISEVSFDLDDTELTTHTQPITATVSRDKKLVVEIRVPSGMGNRSRTFWLGSNSGAETDFSYVKSDYCDISQPTPTALLPGEASSMHFIMSIHGTTLSSRR